MEVSAQRCKRYRGGVIPVQLAGEERTARADIAAQSEGGECRRHITAVETDARRTLTVLAARAGVRRGARAAQREFAHAERIALDAEHGAESTERVTLPAELIDTQVARGRERCGQGGAERAVSGLRQIEARKVHVRRRSGAQPRWPAGRAAQTRRLQFERATAGTGGSTHHDLRIAAAADG